jgi:Domain of unknown function (DUF397)
VRLHVRYHARDVVQTQEPMHVQAQPHHTRCASRRSGALTRKPRDQAIRHDKGDLKENQMATTYNGVPAGELPVTAWQKSGRSNPSGNCVELAQLPGGMEIAVRNSRDPQGPALIYTRDEIVAFISGAKDGDFDNLVR